MIVIVGCMTNMARMSQIPLSLSPGIQFINQMCTFVMHLWVKIILLLMMRPWKTWPLFWTMGHAVGQVPMHRYVKTVKMFIILSFKFLQDILIFVKLHLKTCYTPLWVHFYLFKVVYLCLLSLDKFVFKKLTLHFFYVQQSVQEYQGLVRFEEVIKPKVSSSLWCEGLRIWS